MPNFYISKEELDRLGKKLSVNQRSLTAMGKEMHTLTMKRFETQGASGDKAWAPKKINDDRNILAGRTGDLKRSWKYGATDREAVLLSDSPYAHVHQDGAVIRPKPGNKRGLYIPLNTKGYDAYKEKNFDGLKWGTDFVMTKKPVKIPKRGMLPTSAKEMKELVSKFIDILFRKGMSQ